MESLQKSEQAGNKKLQVRNQDNSFLASLTVEQEAVSSIVYEVNQLRQYPLTAVEIAEWADTLLEFKSDLDYEALRFIIQQMKFGNLEYEQKDGVQNLTRAFQKIMKTEKGFQIKKLNVW